MAQTDLKKLVAYSSIGHMGFVMLGLAALNADGVSGAVLQMFSHGCITGALFLLVGIIYERAHHRQIEKFGGLGAQMPLYYGFFMFIGLASLGLPSLSGFVAEFLVLKGAFTSLLLFACLAVLGIVITAAYTLWTIQRMFLGPPREEYSHLPEMNRLEAISLVPLMFVILLVGLYPSVILDAINSTVSLLLPGAAGIR
jgi:NADH-quinone oxidoreductase subunit M